MKDNKRQEIVMNIVQGEGETIEEIMQKPKEYWNEEPVAIGKWGDIAMKMFLASNNSRYLTLCSQGKSNEYLAQINKECNEMSLRLREEMTPPSTGDWYTDWQNLEKMSMRIEEIIIKEYIEPLVLEK